MAKKSPKKAKAGSKASAGPVLSKKSDHVSTHDEGRMDFGGLPDRDLKKNLGCG